MGKVFQRQFVADNAAHRASLFKARAIKIDGAQTSPSWQLCDFGEISWKKSDIRSVKRAQGEIIDALSKDRN
jgi:hypothetical protein